MSLCSIAFPDMFGSTKTYTINDHEATTSNLILMLKSERGSLYGDPYFGTDLRKVIFTQNGIVLKDLVIDEIYTDIITFMPQLQLTRKNIEVYEKNTSIYSTIDCINKLDYVQDLYNFRLTEEE